MMVPKKKNRENITFRRVLMDLIANSVSLVLRKMPLELYFHLWERRGLHILAINAHYQDPVPDTKTLKDDLWKKQSELIGVEINEKKQMKLLSMFSSLFKKEYESFPSDKTSIPYQYYLKNGCFQYVDAEILYGIIRYYKPKRIIEIGSGNSTYLSAQAILKNKEEDDSYECELIAIEPHPNEILKAGFPGLSKLLIQEVQDVPLSEFKKLEENDILFIDSSHVLKIGSDVNYEYLEILPRLNKNVIIHCHDIFSPAEYPEEWIKTHLMFYNEQYLLQAFLAFNDSFEVLWAGSYMHLRHPDKLETAFSSYNRARMLYNTFYEICPASFWIKKTK